MPRYRYTTRSRDKIKPLQCLLRKFPPGAVIDYKLYTSRFAVIWDGFRHPWVPFRVRGIANCFFFWEDTLGNWRIPAIDPPTHESSVKRWFWYGDITSCNIQQVELEVEEPNEHNLGYIKLTALERFGEIWEEVDYADQYQYISNFVPLEFPPTLFMEHRCGHTLLYAQAINPYREVQRMVGEL